MGKKGERKQSKRLSASKSINIKKKEAVFVTRVRPGPHNKKRAIALATALKELAGVASNKREARKIMNKGMVKVDGKPRKDTGFAIGLFDCVTIGKESYEVLLDRKGRLFMASIGKERDKKLCKIVSKKAKKGKILLGLHDGKNVLVDKTKARSGDSIMLGLEKNTVEEVIPLEKGAKVFIAGGRHIGRMGKVTEVVPGKERRPSRIRFEEKGEAHETIKKYAYALEKVK